MWLKKRQDFFWHKNGAYYFLLFSLKFGNTAEGVYSACVSLCNNYLGLCYSTTTDSFTQYYHRLHHAWVSENGLYVHGLKLFAVNTYYQPNEQVDKSICLPLRRDLNSYCITRHMHYKRPQQCFLIKNILSSTKENNRHHSYVNKKSWRFFSHIYVKRLGGKSWPAFVLKPFAPAVRSFLCTETL